MQKTWVWSLVQQLSLGTTTTEPVVQTLGAATSKACVPRACAAQQEKLPQEKLVDRKAEQAPLAATREKLAQQPSSSTTENSETRVLETRQLFKSTS